MNLPKLVILISGNGTNLQAVINAIEDGFLRAEIACVISNNSDAYGLIRAKKHNIPHEIIPHGAQKQDFEKELIRVVKKYSPDLIILAGFMRILSADFVNAFPEKIINLHPALLPDNPQDDEIILPDGKISKVFRGARATEDTWAGDVSYTGCTVHYVTSFVDRGEVIAKSYIKIDRSKTFDEFVNCVHEEEHKIIVNAINSAISVKR